MPLQNKKKLLKAGAVILCAGLFYGYVLIPLGLRLRCPLRVLTGLRCPGCGITDACLAVLHGRLFEAVTYNPGLALAAPVLVWLVYRHLRGKWGRGERILCAAALVFLLAWGVYRNLAGI